MFEITENRFERRVDGLQHGEYMNSKQLLVYIYILCFNCARARAAAFWSGAQFFVFFVFNGSSNPISMKYKR